MDTEDLSDPFCFLSNGKRKIMRLFVTYDKERASMDIPVGTSVKRVKELICDRFKIQQNNAKLGNETEERTILVVYYSGAVLLDDWILSDLSISPGSTLKAKMEDETDPILYFDVTYSHEIMPVNAYKKGIEKKKADKNKLKNKNANKKDSKRINSEGKESEKINLLELSTAELRSMASNKSGLPTSVFRMVSPSGHDMFDCHMVDHYEIRPGSIIRIETWDGWNELLRLSTLGFTSNVLENVSTDDEVLSRFQMKVAMFIAAHFGHLDLAVTLCKHGIPPSEPIGQHPLRQWCSANQHVDCFKAPIHEAVECGKLEVLRSFVTHNVTSIFAKDGHGLQPLNIALRNGEKDCASFLLSKQWTRIPYNEGSIPLAIYSRIKVWCEKAKERVSLTNSFDKSTSKRKIIRAYPLVGQGVFIDGYSIDQISSRSKFPLKPKRKDQDLYLESRYEQVYGLHPEQYYRNLNSAMGRINKNRRSKFVDNISLNDSNRFTGLSDILSVDSDSQPGFQSPDLLSKEKKLKFPKLSTKVSKADNVQSQSQGIQNNSAERKSSKKGNTKKHSKSEPNLTVNKGRMESSIPLPLISIEDTPRPYFYTSFDKENEVKKTLEEYYSARGYMPREYAIRCLSLTNKLEEKQWLARVKVAMMLSRESVKKSIKSDR